MTGTDDTTPAPARQAQRLGHHIGYHYGLNRRIHDQAAPLALASAVAYVIKRRLARWLAAKAAPYQTHKRHE